MKHFLAYGNSDQVSFRTQEVRACFDYMSVPGTIAAYYAEATAAFVRSSHLQYSIDPRTPLFQERLDGVRPSHVSLAERMGPTVASAVSAGANAYFGPAFYSPIVIAEVVDGIIDFQRQYSNSAGAQAVAQKLTRYRRLLKDALGQSAPAPSAELAGPAFVLAPYFAVRDLSDPWLAVCEQIWQYSTSVVNAGEISPAICASDVATLNGALAKIPAGLARTTFFWVAGFDERTARAADLDALWNLVRHHSASKSLVNLYGGFFSICMQYAGLYGFNNGLGYSESRAWPQLSATGAAPARYYVRDLHLFLPPASAQALIAAEPTLACPCTVCNGTTNVAGLAYGDLKRHFALARRWELDMVHSKSKSDVADHLKDALTRGQRGRSRLPVRAQPTLNYLHEWEQALRRLP